MAKTDQTGGTSPPLLEHILKWIRSDFWIIFLLLICLLSNLYTIASVQRYRNQCNNYYIDWIKDNMPGRGMPLNYSGNYSINIFSAAPQQNTFNVSSS